MQSDRPAGTHIDTQTNIYFDRQTDKHTDKHGDAKTSHAHMQTHANPLTDIVHASACWVFCF